LVNQNANATFRDDVGLVIYQISSASSERTAKKQSENEKSNLGDASRRDEKTVEGIG